MKPALGKTIRGKNNDNAWKHHLIDIGVIRQPQVDYPGGAVETPEIEVIRTKQVFAWEFSGRFE